MASPTADRTNPTVGSRSMIRSGRGIPRGQTGPGPGRGPGSGGRGPGPGPGGPGPGGPGSGSPGPSDPARGAGGRTGADARSTGTRRLAATTRTNVDPTQARDERLGNCYWEFQRLNQPDPTYEDKLKAVLEFCRVALNVSVVKFIINKAPFLVVEKPHERVLGDKLAQRVKKTVHDAYREMHAKHRGSVLFGTFRKQLLLLRDVIALYHRHDSIWRLYPDKDHKLWDWVAQQLREFRSTTSREYEEGSLNRCYAWRDAQVGIFGKLNITILGMDRGRNVLFGNQEQQRNARATATSTAATETDSVSVDEPVVDAETVAVEDPAAAGEEAGGPSDLEATAPRADPNPSVSARTRQPPAAPAVASRRAKRSADVAAAAERDDDGPPPPSKKARSLEPRGGDHRVPADDDSDLSFPGPAADTELNFPASGEADNASVDDDAESAYTMVASDELHAASAPVDAERKVESASDDGDGKSTTRVASDEQLAASTPVEAERMDESVFNDDDGDRGSATNAASNKQNAASTPVEAVRKGVESASDGDGHYIESAHKAASDEQHVASVPVEAELELEVEVESDSASLHDLARGNLPQDDPAEDDGPADSNHPTPAVLLNNPTSALGSACSSDSDKPASDEGDPASNRDAASISDKPASDEVDPALTPACATNSDNGESEVVDPA